MTKEKQTIIIADEIPGDMGKHSRDENIVARPILSSCRKELKLVRTNEGKYMILIQPARGNNIIVQCADLDEVRNAIEKIMLNLEQAYWEQKFVLAPEGEKVNIDGIPKDDNKEMLAIKGELYKKLYKLYGRKAHEYQYEMMDNFDGKFENDPDGKQRMFEKIKERVAKEDDGLLAEYKELPEAENAKADELIRKIVEIVMLEGEEYILANLDQITVGGKPLEKTRIIAQKLMERARVSQAEGDVIDFNIVGYSNGIQDYLLKAMYSEKVNLSDEQKNAIAEYKRAGFGMMNGLMRGKFQILEERK